MRLAFLLSRQKLRPSTFFSRVALPAVVALTAVGIALGAVALFAAAQATRLSGDRQMALVRSALADRAVRIGHDQESVTIWNEAQRHAAASSPDAQWFDNNLGVWLHENYGHDEAYVLNGSDRAIYAMRNGKRDRPETFGRRLAQQASPLIDRLRFELAHPSAGDIVPPQRAPGVHAISNVGGHPAILSVKPITGDDGQIRPGAAPALHISVRRLDGDFPAELGHEYQLREARFTRGLRAEGDYRAVPLVAGPGSALGYIIWKPFDPGALMLKRIAPFAAGAFVFVLAMVLWLLRRIRHAMLASEASRTQARYLAFHDPLTGLANRAQFDDRLAHAVALSLQNDIPVALLHLKLDRFRQVTDALGHTV